MEASISLSDALAAAFDPVTKKKESAVINRIDRTLFRPLCVCEGGGGVEVRACVRVYVCVCVSV